MRRNRRCYIPFMAAVVSGILIALLLPMWVCFWMILGILVLICLL